MNNKHTLNPTEPHPCAHSAFEYAKRTILTQPMKREVIASTALSGDRCAEICQSTIDRIKEGQVVSDRYVLGLAWLFKELEEKSHAPLNPDMPAQTLRLHMGELTADEVRVARAAIRWANAQMGK